MKTMRLHGMSRDAFDRFTATVPSWYYEIVAPGFKYNLTDIAAAIGIHQLRRADEFQRLRQAIAARLHGRPGGPAARLPAAAGARTTSTPGTCIRSASSDAAPIGRDALIERLFAAGIGCSVHYIPLHLQPYWRDRYGLAAASFPHSQRAYERMVSLPIYTAHDRCRRRPRRRRAAGRACVSAASFPSATKRVFDIAAALTGLVLLAPLFVAVAVWIRLDSPGPVFFRQERVGRGGVPFRIHKFRTMRVGGRVVRAGAHRRRRSADHPRRRVPAPHQARRAAAADRRAARRHEPGRPAARGAALRRRLSAGAPRQGAERAPRHHRPGVAAVPGRERRCWRAPPIRSASTATSSCRPSCAWRRDYVDKATLAGDLRLIASTLRALWSRP